MPKAEHLIVGGGMAAEAAACGIREVIPSASITLVGDAPDPPLPRTVWDRVEAARQLIAEPGPFRPAELKGSLVP